MKILPNKLSNELFLKIDYLILRFMESKKAYKINQNEPTLFTIKKIQEINLPPQYQFHIRFFGKDKWLGVQEHIDFDFYISEKEFDKIKSGYVRQGDNITLNDIA